MLCRNDTGRDARRKRLAEYDGFREPTTLRLISEVRELQRARLP